MYMALRTVLVAKGNCVKGKWVEREGVKEMETL